MTATTVTADFFAGCHPASGARAEMASFFAGRKRIARGTPASQKKTTTGRQQSAWLRGRGAVIWQADGPHLVVCGTRTPGDERGEFVEHVVTVPVEPDGSTADRQAEKKYLTERLAVLLAGADDVRGQAEHDAEVEATRSRLAAL